MTVAQLEREVRLLKIYAALLTVAIVVSLGVARAGAQPGAGRFTVLDAERLNIVEADGRPALVLANTQRLPGPMIAGKELPKELSSGRTGSAGLIFIDAQGNEVGGLAYSATVRPDGTYAADSSLTFDQHNQDQVVGFQYQDDGSSRLYGLSVWDRPTKVSITELLDAARGAPDRASRHRRFEALLKERGEIGEARRAFLGSENRTAALKLADPAGRERIRLYVDQAGAAKLEFLDEAGKIVYAVPDRSR